MGPSRLLARCVRHVASGALADVGYGGFRYGARVVHFGGLVDQRQVAESIRRAAAHVASAHPAGKARVARTLRRITIRIAKAKLGDELGMRAHWSGGYRDRGFVDVAAVEGYVESIAKGVAALLEEEMR